MTLTSCGGGSGGSGGPSTPPAPPPKTSKAPVLESFNPPRAKAGADIQVIGTGFTGPCQVKFQGSASPADAEVQSPFILKVTVPNDAVTGPAFVLIDASASSGPVDFTVIPRPVITALEPPSGRVSDPIQIQGAHFLGDCQVTFPGAAPVAATRISEQRLSVNVPAGALSGNITVTAEGGDGVSPAAFTVLTPGPPQLAITGFNPASAPANASIQILGAGFAPPCTVTFQGGAAATLVSADSANQLTVLVPPGAQTGPVTVKTATLETTSTMVFTLAVPGPPTLTGITPAVAGVGDTITLQGTDLGGAVVTFAGSTTPQTATLLSPTQAQVAVPVDARSGVLQVTTPLGSATSATAFTLFKVASALPSSAAPWQTVRILGSGFSTPGLTAQAGALGAVPLTVVSDAEARFTVGTWGASAPGIQLRIGSKTLSTPFTVLPPRDAMFTQALTPVVNPNEPPVFSPAQGRYLDFPAARRTRQYPVAFLPQAPVFHAYNAGSGRLIFPTPPFPGIRNFSRFLLNFRLPGAFLEALPPAIQARVADVDTDDLFILFVSQDQLDTPGSMEFRAHYIVDPDAPGADPAFVDLNVNAEVTLVGADPGVTVTGAAASSPQGPLLGSVYLHKGDAAGTVVSSPDNFQVPALTDAVGQSFWSLTRWVGRDGRQKAAATLHWLLTDAQEAALEAVTADTSATGGPAPVATPVDLMASLLTSAVLSPTQGVQNLRSLGRPILRQGLTDSGQQVLLGSGFTGAAAILVDGGAPIPLAGVALSMTGQEIRMNNPIPPGSHTVVIRTPLGDSDPVQVTF
jgi:hypothetical protein